MNEDPEERYPLTEIDRIANGNSLLMLKALLPYFPSGNRAGIAFMIKWMEIQNIQNHYRRHPAAPLTAMSLPSHSTADILKGITPFCPKEQKEMLEQFQNMMEMLELMENMQDFSGGEHYEQPLSTFGHSAESGTKAKAEPESGVLDE